MAIWQKPASLEAMTAFMADTLASHIGIEFTELGDASITARMPVDARTRQAYGIMHGGASATLAETIGSVAGYLSAPENKLVVGLELNCNHIRSMREGFVYGTASPLHLGGSTQVWDIRIVNEAKQLVCIARLTLAVINNKQ